MSHPTDPIRDAELSDTEIEEATLRKRLAAADVRLREEAVRKAAERLLELKDGPRDEAYRRAKQPAWASLRAALQEDPPVRRYSVEEVRELLLGRGAEAAARSTWNVNGRLKGERDWGPDFPRDRATWIEEATRDLDAALTAAFDGATPTQPSLSDLRERIRTERDSYEAAAPPSVERDGALTVLNGLLAYIEGGKDG